VYPQPTTRVDVNSSVLFYCVACGTPQPTVSWLQSGVRLVNGSSNVTIRRNPVTIDGVTFVQSLLEMCRVQGDDGAVYECFVENEAGSDTVPFNLIVEGT